MAKTLYERINDAARGGCYRFKGDSEEKVFHPAGLECDASGNQRLKVWYVVLEARGSIPFNKRIETDLEEVSVTEIDKIRERYEKNPEPNIISLQPALEAREKKERAESYEEISHLADHLFPKKE